MYCHPKGRPQATTHGPLKIRDMAQSDCVKLSEPERLRIQLFATARGTTGQFDRAFLTSWHFGARGVPACVALHPAADVRQRNAGTHWWIIVCLLRYTPRAATVGVARLLVRVLAAARVGG